MNHTFAAQTDPGKVRQVNQDRVECDPEGRYFLVADGMGGHPGGKEASSLAVRAAREYLDTHFESDTDTQELVKQTVIEANRRIREAQQANPEHAEMGTTLTIVVYREQQWWYAHVGDSRVYRWHEGTIEQVTPDHTWIAEQIRAGESENDPILERMLGHILFQHMGQEDLNRIDIDTINVDSGDRLLLCSDGLTPELSEEEIAEHLAQEATCEETVNALISTANENGGTDNIAVIVIDC